MKIFILKWAEVRDPHREAVFMKIMMNAETAMDNHTTLSETECFQDEESLQLKADIRFLARTKRLLSERGLNKAT